MTIGFLTSLLMKLLLVPLFIATATLAGRRFGPQTAGLLGGLPVVAGPITLILAIDQGPSFAAESAISSIAAIAALLTFGTVYAWTSQRAGWPVALVLGLGAWTLAATVLTRAADHAPISTAIGCVALLITPHALPKVGQSEQRKTRQSADIALRMAIGACLALTVTASAAQFGAIWSGLLAAFPVMGVVLAVFTHRAANHCAVAQLFRGMVLGLWSFATFFLALALLLNRSSVLVAFVVATVIALASQFAVRYLQTHRIRTLG